MSTRTTTEHLQGILADYLARVPTAHAFGCEWVEGNTPGITRELLAAHGPGRVHLMPVSARTAIGNAVGASVAGIPVVLHLPDTECLRRGVDLFRGLPSQTTPTTPPFVVRVPYGAEAIGVDIPIGQWHDGLPEAHVLCPSDAGAAQRALRWALAQRTLSILLEPRQLSAERSVEVDGVEVSTRTLRAGDHVTLISWGAATAVCIDATEALAAKGVSASLLDLECVWPLDRGFLGQIVRASGRAVIVHNHDPSLADRVRTAVIEEAFLYLEAPVACSITHLDEIVQASLSAVQY